MKFMKTARGFELIEFKDDKGQDCSLQQSSAIDFNVECSVEIPGSSKIWLGTDNDRMHLTKDMARVIVHHINKWIETGSFE